jgi:hypothetical protein
MVRANGKFRICIQRILLIISILFNQDGVAQNLETNPNNQASKLWLFGKNIWLEFESNSVIQKKTNQLNILEGTTSYYSESSSCFLLGNGNWGSKISIKGKKSDIVFNDDAAQGILFIVHPDNERLIVLGSGRTGNCGYVLETEDSTYTDYQTFPFFGGEKQQAINHQNGRDIWYANHARQGDSVFFFLIKKDGLVSCPVVTHTGLNYTGDELGFSTQGQMKFSPDGKYLAEVTFVDPFGYGVYEFDTEYPKTDSIFIFQKRFNKPYTKRWPYGIEFSTNSKQLYLTTGRNDESTIIADPVILYQLSIDSLRSVGASKNWIGIDSITVNESGSLQLAPDGKIYMAMPNKNYLGVINNPNNVGASCNYQRQGLMLDSGGISQYGLPTFNQSYFYTPAIDFKYQENCLTNSYTFWGLDTFNANQHQWSFTDKINNKEETLSGKNISYSFKQDSHLENKYTVRYIANNGNRSDTVIKTITIRPKLNPNFLGKDTFYCQGSKAQITLKTPPNMHCIHWNTYADSVSTKVLEPFSNPRQDTVIGYENFYGYIAANQSRSIDTAGVYIARITNKAFCTVTDTITVYEHDQPEKSGIGIFKDSLVSNTSAYKYRWYYNGKPRFETAERKLKPDSNGFWQVQLISNYGCESELSDSVLVDYVSTSVNKPFALDFKLYPNPSDGQITIELGEGLKNKGLSIRITDALGKIVYKASSQYRETILLNTKLPAGSYTITLNGLDGSRGSKVFVVK